MKKIPFDIKYRKEIESGKYKVETKSGEPVEIVLWNWCDGFPFPILGRIGNDGDPKIWTSNGYINLGETNNENNLLIITDDKDTEEEKLTEFEDSIKSLINSFAAIDSRVGDTTAKNISERLMFIAKKEIVKNLPIWKKADKDWTSSITPSFVVIYVKGDCVDVMATNRIKKGEYFIAIHDLLKLNKEDK